MSKRINAILLPSYAVMGQEETPRPCEFPIFIPAEMEESEDMDIEIDTIPQVNLYHTKLEKCNWLTTTTGVSVGFLGPMGRILSPTISVLGPLACDHYFY